tara:strand:+ start:535 stop:1068 length:534 start_codon:yes stop_codon:yes gene_type:complete
MSNLRLINETLTQSFVAEISIDNIFTTDFDVYKITIGNCEYEPTGTDVVDMRFRFRNSSGSTISASNYSAARMQMKAEATKDEDKITDQPYIYGICLVGNSDNAAGHAFVYNPADSSSYTFITGQGAGGYDTSNHKWRMTKLVGVLEQANTVSGLNIVSNNGQQFKADIRVYGLAIN